MDNFNLREFYRKTCFISILTILILMFTPFAFATNTDTNRFENAIDSIDLINSIN